MDIHALPGIGASPGNLLTNKRKNVRIIGNLEAVATTIFSTIEGKLINKPWFNEVDAPFPYEAGLGFFVRISLCGSRDGYFFCLTGRYRKRWLLRLTQACAVAATVSMAAQSPGEEEQIYVELVKKFLDLT